MSDTERTTLRYHEADMVKDMYLKQRAEIILAEAEREKQREMEMRFETCAISRERLHRHHEEQRQYYRTEIERINGECEFSMASKMIGLGLLR